MLVLNKRKLFGCALCIQYDATFARALTLPIYLYIWYGGGGLQRRRRFIRSFALCLQKANCDFFRLDSLQLKLAGNGRLYIVFSIYLYMATLYNIFIRAKKARVVFIVFIVYTI